MTAQEVAVAEPKPQAGSAARPARKPAEKSADGDPRLRYFLAGDERNGAAPSLGREVTSENEALIESIKTGMRFYVVSEYRAVADMTGKTPLIRKEAVKKAEARDER